MSNKADYLVATYIAQDPHRPGVYNAVLKQYVIPVWALAAHLRVLSENVAQVAAEYKIPHEAVEAALAYYHKYQDMIDARIDANNAPNEYGTPIMLDVA